MEDNSIKVTKDRVLVNKFDHPSYGFVRVNKVYGNIPNLFCTNVDHNSVIEITIGKAQGYANSTTMRHMADRDDMVVYVTANQWAELVSSFGSGSGVPCTIHKMGGKYVKRPTEKWEYAKNVGRQARESVQQEVDNNINEALETLYNIKNGNKKLGKKDLDKLIHQLNIAKNNIPANMEYFFDKLEEDAEKVTTEAIMNAEAVIGIFKDKVVERALGFDTFMLETKNGEEDN